jgi:flagellum-specific peptidoglycan hydrolase FlgJ
MTSAQIQWLFDTAYAAMQAQHIWPEMAACEAALESGYGSSALAREANNLFGMKQHQHPVQGTLSLPTKEFLDGEWTIVNAEWVKYDTVADCFEDRMDTLERLQGVYPHYAAALAAKDVFQYITEVSATWSTDPQRASKVTAIYNEFVANTKESHPADLSMEGDV